uniref:Uncharacterized protein n=1 Tax=Panagrolaimus sp. JU765 TaxID=591449 RepID=A0AC34QZ98_9BILA
MNWRNVPICKERMLKVRRRRFEFSRSQLRLLQNSNVKSLRLTMQKGSPIPFCEKLLLINLQNLEFIGEMKINCQFIKKQFPNLNHFEIDQQDLAS